MTAAAPAATPATRNVRSRIGAYVALTKPRIVELLLVTTVPVMVVAERGIPSGWLILATVIGGTLAAGGANAVNMYVDRDIDAIMHRTRNRPLVTGMVTPRAALTFAVAIEAIAFVWLWVLVNPISAGLGLAACLFYVFVYTLWLKRTSRQNIVIGGAAGAVPVLIGWAAVTGELSWAPWVLFALMFFWTPPHFWALAVRYRDDYAAADVPMLPAVTDLRTTSRQILGYTVLVVACSVGFWWAADLGPLYLAGSLVLGAVFVALCTSLMRTGSSKVAMRLFSWSITYVTLLFALMAIDVLVWP